MQNFFYFILFFSFSGVPRGKNRRSGREQWLVKPDFRSWGGILIICKSLAGKNCRTFFLFRNDRGGRRNLKSCAGKVSNSDPRSAGNGLRLRRKCLAFRIRKRNRPGLRLHLSALPRLGGRSPCPAAGRVLFKQVACKNWWRGRGKGV